MRRSHIRSIICSTFVGLTFALTACGSSDTVGPVTPLPPTMQSLAATYRAAPAGGSSAKIGVLTTTTSAGVTTDELGKGASIQLTLNSNGTTAGHIAVPDGNLDADLTGTWVLTGNQVKLTQSADTFLRDITYTATGDQLDGASNFSGSTVHVTLRR